MCMLASDSVCKFTAAGALSAGRQLRARRGVGTDRNAWGLKALSIELRVY